MPGSLSQHTYMSFLSHWLSRHLAWGVPTPDVCEQSLGCLAGVLVVNTRWKVCEAWAFLSLSIRLPGAESLVLGRCSQSGGLCHSRCLPGPSPELPADLTSRQ